MFHYQYLITKVVENFKLLKLIPDASFIVYCQITKLVTDRSDHFILSTEKERGNILSNYRMAKCLMYTNG